MWYLQLCRFVTTFGTSTHVQLYNVQDIIQNSSCKHQDLHHYPTNFESDTKKTKTLTGDFDVAAAHVFFCGKSQWIALLRWPTFIYNVVSATCCKCARCKCCRETDESILKCLHSLWWSKSLVHSSAKNASISSTQTNHCAVAQFLLKICIFNTSPPVPFDLINTNKAGAH